MSERRYTVREEILHSLTHGVGLLLAVLGSIVLLHWAFLRGNPWHIVGCSIFSATLIFMYAASTLYHSVPTSDVKRALRIVDHLAIYLLIAGTYTPFMLVNMRGPWGWLLFGLIWGLALFGIWFKLTSWNRYKAVSVLLYLGMGWLVVIALKPLLETVAPTGVLFLFLGGLAYTGGVIFYAWQKLPYQHAIWHLFVMTGSALHFVSIFYYVVPKTA